MKITEIFFRWISFSCSCMVRIIHLTKCDLPLNLIVLTLIDTLENMWMRESEQEAEPGKWARISFYHFFFFLTRLLGSSLPRTWKEFNTMIKGMKARYNPMRFAASYYTRILTQWYTWFGCLAPRSGLWENLVWSAWIVFPHRLSTCTVETKYEIFIWRLHNDFFFRGILTQGKLNKIAERFSRGFSQNK